MPDFSIRDFLRSQEALLVHFSTPMTNHPEISFPDDIKGALACNGPLCFSTIQVNSTGPFTADGMLNADANAVGSVGMIVDVSNNSSVLSVCEDDGGSYCDSKTGSWISLGKKPSLESCAASLSNTNSHNDWGVKDFIPVGIFIFRPIFVRLVEGGSEVPIELEEIHSIFSNLRIVSIKDSGFCQLVDRQWIPITYDQIMNPLS